uniref:CG4733-PA n=1 Tax=Drosophila erecta TaxID=7220 RepID=Q8I1J5_DROER|nr:CG4733-PA [Drosophila erecta]
MQANSSTTTTTTTTKTKKLSSGTGANMISSVAVTSAIKTTTTTRKPAGSGVSPKASKASNSSSATSDSNAEIAELTKKINDHADAIYLTWKSQGIPPPELLQMYTNAAASGDLSDVASPTADAEGLQKMVTSFVNKDKEQRGKTNSLKKSDITANGKVKKAVVSSFSPVPEQALQSPKKVAAVSVSHPLPDVNLNYDISLDLDVSNLSSQQTQNLLKISELIQQQKDAPATSKASSSGSSRIGAAAVSLDVVDGPSAARMANNTAVSDKGGEPAATTSRKSSKTKETSADTKPATKEKPTAAATVANARKSTMNLLTRGSVAERVLMFEKCPDVRHAFLNIKRPQTDPPPKSLLKRTASLIDLRLPQDAMRETHILLSGALAATTRECKQLVSEIRFYFPHGKPQPNIAMERVVRGILSAFDSFPNNQVTKDELPRILKICGLPFYWRMPVMVFCQSASTGLVERQRFVEFWKQMNVYCHEAASRFVYILSRGQRFRSYIVPEDLVPMVQDVVDTHPGLAFLKEATEFHSRYVHTVIARIFYSVNRSWSGKITIAELKRSDLLEMISLLEEEEDINQIMAFFSYEHFYVIYCKFWELDKDHDLLINQEDLAKHSDHALSSRIVERIFSGCVTRSDNKKAPEDEAKMSYTDFVWFILSEEDKRTPTAIEYWFRCMDVDGDGVLSMYELEYFYEEQQQRMEGIGIECLPFEDCLCQMLDMIKPANRDCITLGDLKRCKMTHVFFDTFFNLEKYLDHEQRDPFASQRDEYTSDWDRFAAQEYELLISEEND